MIPSESTIVGIAELPGDVIVPGGVPVLISNGPLQGRVDVVTRRDGQQAIGWSAEQVPDGLLRAAGRHDIRAWAYGRPQGQLQIVQALYLASDGCGGGNCWPAGMAKAELPADLAEWWQPASLSAMGLRPPIRNGQRKRPHGLGVTYLQISGSIKPGDDARITSLIRFARGSIDVALDSKGGDIGAATAIADALESHEHRVTVRMRECSSAASLIASAGDDRIMAPDGFSELHKPFFTDANTLPAAEQERVLDRTFSAMADRLARRTGQPSSSTRKWLSSNVTLDAVAARQVNLATEIAEPTSARRAA